MPDTYTLTVDGHPLVVNVNLELEAWDYVPPVGTTGIFEDAFEDQFE